MTIREARHAAGLTQAKMAEILGIPRRTVEDWDSGKHLPPEYVRRLVIEKLQSLTK